MEDDEYQLEARQPEYWEIRVDARVVAEANARLRELAGPARKKLWRQRDAAFASFAEHIEFSRHPVRAAGTTSNQWLPSGKDAHHIGRAYTDIDVLSSPEFRGYPAYTELSRELHPRASRALPLAISLIVLRDARWSDGFSIRIARDLSHIFGRPRRVHLHAESERFANEVRRVDQEDSREAKVSENIAIRCRRRIRGNQKTTRLPKRCARLRSCFPPSRASHRFMNGPMSFARQMPRR
jgi:hypothetical protein